MFKFDARKLLFAAPLICIYFILTVQLASAGDPSVSMESCPSGESKLARSYVESFVTNHEETAPKYTEIFSKLGIGDADGVEKITKSIELCRSLNERYATSLEKTEKDWLTGRVYHPSNMHYYRNGGLIFAVKVTFINPGQHSPHYKDPKLPIMAISAFDVYDGELELVLRRISTGPMAVEPVPH